MISANREVIWEMSVEAVGPAVGGKATFEVRLEPFTDKGTYRLEISFSPLVGEWVTLGAAEEIRVDWDWSNYAKAYSAFFGIGLLIVHTVAFGGLLFGARWSPWCFRVVTDPIWGKLGIYFRALLRHVRPLQIWLFERYFQAVRKNLLTDTPYLPLPLSGQKGERISSIDLLDQLKTTPRIWLQGNAGMGKTVTVEHLKAAYSDGNTIAGRQRGLPGEAGGARIGVLASRSRRAR